MKFRGNGSVGCSELRSFPKRIKPFHLPNLLLKKHGQLIQKLNVEDNLLNEGMTQSPQMETALTYPQQGEVWEIRWDSILCSSRQVCVHTWIFSVCVCFWSIVLETHRISTGPKCHINADASMSVMVLCGLNERISDLGVLQQPARGSESSWNRFFKRKLKIFSPWLLLKGFMAAWLVHFFCF